MHKSIQNRFRFHNRFLTVLGLLVVWVTGAWVGYLFYRSLEHVFISLMCGSCCDFVSIIMLLAGVTIPFLITAYAVHYKQNHILYLLCFTKAFSYAVAVFSVYGVYGNAGWLMHFFLLFSENVSVCLLLFLWLQCLLERNALMPAFVRCGCIALLGWGFDMIVVAPFVVSFTSF